MKVVLLFSLISVLLSACVLNPTSKKSLPNKPSLATSYDVALYDSGSKQRISLKQMANDLHDADVVFVGEYHGNHASHWLQAQLQSALYANRPQQILSLEQFSTDKQAELDRYLDDEIGEVALLKNANAWPNYKASYRPLVEFAKQHDLPVIAANAPADIVRCIGRQGESYLEKLTPEQRKLLAGDTFMNDKAYQAAFQKVMHSSPSAPATKAKPRLSNSYLAQLSRDNTMAESILTALDEQIKLDFKQPPKQQATRQSEPNPKRNLKQYARPQVIHMNGAFHSDSRLGTVALLKQRRPELRIKVISPVRMMSGATTKTPYAKGDYVYLLKPQPEQYANDEERSVAFKSMFSKARSKVCQ